MLKRKHFFSSLLILSIIISMCRIPVFADDYKLIVPSPDNVEGRRVLFFQDFEDKRTSYWNMQGEGAPEVKEIDGSSVYSVQQYDLFDFTNAEKLANFTMEYNMKFSIPKENRGKAWPAIYLKSLNPTSRYELFFESAEGAESVTLRRNGKNTLTVPISFYEYNEKWVYVKVEVNGPYLSLYLNDPDKPILTYEDKSPPPPALAGFTRGRTDYHYIDNLLITAAPLSPGEEDTAFIGAEEPAPKSDNIYGKTYIDTDFSEGLDPAFTDIGEKTVVEDGIASVKGRLHIGDKNWDNYSVEMDFTLKDKKPIINTDPFFKFRYEDEFNYYLLRANTAGSSIQLYKCERGALTWVGQMVFYLPEKMHKMRLDVFDDTFRLYLRSTSYPDFEYPVMTLTDSSISNGGIEICDTPYISHVEVDKLIVRELKELGNTGPRPTPEPFVTVAESPYKSWTDITGHWASEILEYMSNIGAVCGYPDNTFRPDASINVNEAIKILCVANGIEASDTNVNWAIPYINAATEIGWITDSTFDRYDRPILRSELVDMVKNASSTEDISRLVQGYENGKLDLDSQITRAEAITIIARSLSDVFIPNENTTFVSLEEYDHGFANPYKGFRNIVGEPYVTTDQIDFKWNEIESNANDGVDKIIAVANQRFEGLPENNAKAIVGVFLEFPPNTYWPSDMTTGDYSSPEFQKRLEKMIEKLALAFDNDPRVAAVKMKIIGKWGEMQDPAPTPEVAALMEECFHKHFKNKPVMVNIGPHISMFHEYDFGTHWDSFGHWGNIAFLDYFETDFYNRLWKTQMTVGETAFDWGEPLGKNPNDAVINHKDRLIELFRGTHCSSVSWLARYDKNDPETTAAASDIQKVLGYRFVLQNARFTKNAQAGGNFDISFNVANTGSAPIYYNEPIELSLLDPETHEVVWSKIFTDTNIREWLPDDEYDHTPIYTVSDTFTLPENLKDGIYTVALSILDSQGGYVPSVRFANTNYYKGGRTPLGNISIGADVPVPQLDKTEFADLFTDRLHYIYTPKN